MTSVSSIQVGTQLVAALALKADGEDIAIRDVDLSFPLEGVVTADITILLTAKQLERLNLKAKSNV